jgi:hypothetical protein
VPSEPGLVRLLVAFRRDPGEQLVGKWELRGISLPELRALFGADATDPMYDSWPVGSEHVTRLTLAADHEIDLEAFDYFVEAGAD